MWAITFVSQLLFNKRNGYDDLCKKESYSIVIEVIMMFIFNSKLFMKLTYKTKLIYKIYLIENIVNKRINNVFMVDIWVTQKANQTRPSIFAECGIGEARRIVPPLLYYRPIADDILSYYILVAIALYLEDLHR